MPTPEWLAEQFEEHRALALLVVLEALEPAERLAFVLHDVFGMQLRDLNEKTSGVVQHGDLGAGRVRGWRGGLGAARFHPFVIGLHVVGEEHGRGLALLEHRLLVALAVGLR